MQCNENKDNTYTLTAYNTLYFSLSQQQELPVPSIPAWLHPRCGGSFDYMQVIRSNKIRQGMEALRKTTLAHQMALAVVFESGVQNISVHS